jgi:hypothetical protein
MECTELRTEWRDWARHGGTTMPPAARAHLESCAKCAAEWQSEQELTAAFSHLRASSARASASPAVRAAVTRVFPAVSAALPANPPRFDWRQFPALAALLVVAIAAGWLLSRAKAPAAPARSARVAQPLYTDFFPLSGVALDRHEAAQVIRIRLRRGEMRRFGLPVSEALERAPVEADVVIGQDGVARAIRFVSSNQ